MKEGISITIQYPNVIITQHHWKCAWKYCHVGEGLARGTSAHSPAVNKQFLRVYVDIHQTRFALICAVYCHCYPYNMSILASISITWSSETSL